MTNQEQLDGMEEALVELRSAEEAGVFEPTDVDAALLVTTPAPLTRLHIRAIIGTVAAAIVLSIGIGSWMFSGEIDDLRDRAQGPQSSQFASASDSKEPCDGSFYGCMTGPADAMPSECDVHDYDEDGDVDLTDYGRYQLACIAAIGTP